MTYLFKREKNKNIIVYVELNADDFSVLLI